MNKFTRFAQWLTPGRVLLGLLACALILCGLVLRGLVGLIALTLVTAWLVCRSLRQARRDWTPNVHGENAYQILGVARSADTPTIRRAFRELQRRYHPDATPPERKADAAAAFIRINQAYELLSNAELRYEYDGLIDAADGRIPPFEDAYLRVRNEEKNPIYAAYDAVYPADRPSCTAGRSEGSAPEGTGVGRAAHDSDTGGRPPLPPESPPADGGPSGGGDTRGAVVDVDIPESIREAMGLPPPPPPGPPGQ